MAKTVAHAEGKFLDGEIWVHANGPLAYGCSRFYHPNSIGA
jgi:hypothetical protein